MASIGRRKTGFQPLVPVNCLLTASNDLKSLAIFVTRFGSFPERAQLKKVYLVQEEATSDEIPQTLEFDITSLSEIEKSGLFRSSYISVLCDEDFTFALKLHYEGFGFLSGPDELCQALHASRVVAPVLEDVEWKN